RNKRINPRQKPNTKKPAKSGLFKKSALCRFGYFGGGLVLSGEDAVIFRAQCTRTNLSIEKVRLTKSKGRQDPPKTTHKKARTKRAFLLNQLEANSGILAEDWCFLARRPAFFERNVHERT
ncbi:MAG: hypothetical protein MRY76_15820, partial [Pseudomonadales bacterium]|nr:hypothetical protein [Pseudomonadales bacterium]